MLDISKKRDLGSGVDGDSQKTLPKIGVKAVQRLAGLTDSASDSLLSSTIGIFVTHVTQYETVFFVGFRNLFIDEQKSVFMKLAINS
ncbi:MAG: hypothetical protein ACJAWV_001739 [Flammeovirgaceae bacterium]|jgi:hypothetical protein